MLLKPRLRRSDVPLHSSFANGFAILMQTNRSAARRLARCYGLGELDEAISDYS
jgi:hypothetical protein